MMHCPICSTNLHKTKFKSFVCPSGHGGLLTTKQLRQKEEAVIKKTDPGTAANVAAQRAHRIACPHCSNEMFIVNYSQSGILLDSCMNCHYRWIDAGELHKIKAHEPKLDSVDFAMLSRLDQRIVELENLKDFTHNPAYRLENLGPLSVLHAVYYGLKHSWFTRIVTLGILIGIALAYSAVIDYFQSR